MSSNFSAIHFGFGTMIRKFHFIDWKQNRKGKKRKNPNFNLEKKRGLWLDKNQNLGGRRKEQRSITWRERRRKKIGVGFSLCSILGSNGEEETGMAKKNGFFLRYRIMPLDGVVWLNKKEGLL